MEAGWVANHTELKMNSSHVMIKQHFIAESNIEVPAVTAAQMREIDRIATEETGPILYQMMENAGRNLAAMAIELLGSRWNRGNIMILAGSGGNGGGGICAARHLASRSNNIHLCLSAPHRLQQVSELQFKTFKLTSGQEIKTHELPLQPKPDLIIDALLGYGLETAPRGETLAMIQWANATKTPILSLDIPSGVNATTGETPGDFIHAQWTMTLALPKTGLLPQKTGQLVLADIGIPEGLYQKLGLVYTAPFGNRFWISLNSYD